MVSPRTVSLLLSPVLLVAGAELACGVAQDWAWPHLNVYVPDTTLGVRLRPGATTRVGFAGNPATDFRVNAQGYRGADWPDRADVLVVGDSQVFGLGVEEAQTAAAVLGARTGKVVLDGGVPTYGPEEYLAVVQETLTARKVHDVVVVFNAANDFFELARPDRERHVVRDGWAERVETAEPEGPPFPGRDWLYGHSHALLAWRQWRHADPHLESVPSEGNAADLLPTAGPAPRSPNAAEAETTVKLLEAATYADPDVVDRKLAEALGYAGGPDDTIALAAALDRRPIGARVGNPFAEENRSVVVTAELLEHGAELRRRLHEQFRAYAAANPDEYGVREGLLALAAAGDPPDAGVIAPLAAPSSPVHDWLVRTKAVTDAAGATLTLVVLPLDVQVDPVEFLKYGAPHRDLGDSLALLEEVAVDAYALGVRVVEPLAALRAAEPGAFLDGDLHLSAKGQAVLADGLATALAGPPPVRWPDTIDHLPAGRSRVPNEAEWARARTTAAGVCLEAHVREWVRLDCPEAVPATAASRAQGPLETWTVATSTCVSTTFPDVGGPVAVDVKLADGTTDRLVWSAGRLDAAARRAPPKWRDRCTFPRGARDACAAVAPDDDSADACARGERLVLPSCGVGEINAGAAGFCAPLCDEAHACAAGTCTAWAGTGVCS